MQAVVRVIGAPTRELGVQPRGIHPPLVDHPVGQVGWDAGQPRRSVAAPSISSSPSAFVDISLTLIPSLLLPTTPRPHISAHPIPSMFRLVSIPPPPHVFTESHWISAPHPFNPTPYLCMPAPAAHSRLCCRLFPPTPQFCTFPAVHSLSFLSPALPHLYFRGWHVHPHSHLIRCTIGCKATARTMRCSCVHRVQRWVAVWAACFSSAAVFV